MGIGDEMMAAGQARRAQEKDPRRVKILDAQGRPRHHVVWSGNPRIAGPYEAGDFQTITNAPRARPYILAKTDAQWTWNLDFRADAGEFYFSSQEVEFGKKFAGRVIIEPNTKSKASPNKQWGTKRWEKLVALLLAEGLQLAQIGERNVARLRGLETIETSSYKLAASVLANSAAAVIPEGGLHHAAAAVNLSAVVIFGGYIPVEVTGYSMHTNFGVSGGEACGLRQKCAHCDRLMASIEPEQIAASLLQILAKQPLRSPAYQG
jgi:hypothetical protein